MVDKRSAPAFSMGSPLNKTKHTNDFNPGPGSYEPPSFINSSKISKTKQTGQRFRQQISTVPGPGAYNSLNKQHAPSALVLSRSKQQTFTSHQAPGPGSYEPNYKTVVKNDSGYKIGGSAKIGDIVGQAKYIPGPCNYETNTSTCLLHHSAKIGSERRSEMVLNNYTPGPGQYQDSKIHITLKRQPNSVIGKSSRSYSSSNIAPGPGTYTYDSFRDSNKSKGFSISSRHPQIPAYTTRVPGPGAYNALDVELLRQKGASFSIGKGPKLQTINERQVMAVPGPERYNIAQGAFQQKGSIFGREKRASLAENVKNPGPGSYTVNSHSTLPQFSIPRSNTSWIKGSANPGPGTYESRVVHDQGSTKMSKDKRRAFYDQKMDIPGPGSYNYPAPSDKTTGYKIGNQKRGGEKVSTNPGPGNYNIPSTVSNLPKYSH